MATTTIRVHTATRTRLADLAKESNATLTDAVRDAAEALYRQRFAAQVEAEVGRLAVDPILWSEYTAEAEPGSVDDGID